MNMDAWMAEYLRRMEAAFGKRLRFIGLQGSRARGEAGEDSDIDVVCVLDVLGPQDVTAYRAALEGIERRNLVCGFLSGWEELRGWEPSELFQFCLDTLPVKGNLDALLEKVGAGDVARAVRIGAGNVCHGCVHNMVHARNLGALRELYKAAEFAFRAAHYLRSGAYVRTNAELMPLLPAEEREILGTAMALRAGETPDFDKASGALLGWAQGVLHKFA